MLFHFINCFIFQIPKEGAIFLNISAVLVSLGSLIVAFKGLKLALKHENDESFSKLATEKYVNEKFHSVQKSCDELKFYNNREHDQMVRQTQHQINFLITLFK